MANCLEFLTAVVASGQAATLPALNHDTLSVVSFSRNSCKSFYLTFPVFTVVDFTTMLVADPSTPFTYEVKLYKINGLTMAEVATLSSTDQTSMFSKEFTAGSYLVCYQTTTPVTLTGTVLPVFRGYQRYAVMSPEMHDGQSFTPAFDGRRPPADCSAELFFELIEGSLPPGIRLNSAGMVLGVAPNLDCIEDTANLPPAQNWSFQHNDASFHPWGMQWRFKVRVSLLDIREVFAEEWFCVKVHNNWSLDRDNFLTQAPFLQEVYEESVEHVMIPNLCPVPVDQPWEPTPIVLPCPPNVVPKFEVERIPDPGCPSCNGQEVVETIPMPFGVPGIGTDGFDAWMAGVSASVSPQVAEFLERFANSPIYQQYLRDETVEFTQVGREIVLRTYVDDPTTLFWKWREEQTRRLPWGIDILDGHSLSVELDVPKGRS